jgi:Ca2+-binding EF-hand superfamily protein
MRIWIPALAALVMMACTTDPTLTAENELILSAIAGEEEDLRQGEGDFTSNALRQNGEIDMPALLRICRAADSYSEILGRYDDDGDGQLSEEERSEVWQARQDRPEHHRRHRAQLWQRLLRIYDTDCDGQLSEEERSALMDDFSARCEALHQRLLETFDADGDGQLDEDEMEALRADLQARRQERRQRMLDRLDHNDDGEIDADERPGRDGSHDAHCPPRRPPACDEHGELERARARMRDRIRNGDDLRCEGRRGHRGDGGPCPGRHGGGDDDSSDGDDHGCGGQGQGGNGGSR